MIRRRLEPKPNHALFFPKQKPASVIIGQGVFVGRFRRIEVKHIQLDDFQMSLRFGDGLDNPPAKTMDDLECSVDVFLRLEIKRDSDSLSLATATWPASSSLQQIVTNGHFKNQLQSSLVSTIESQVRKVRYLDLLLTGDEKSKLETSVKDACTLAIESRGFFLVGCRVDVHTVEPTADILAHNPTLSQEWNAYVARKHNLEREETKTKNEHSTALLKLDNDHKLEQKQLEAKSEVDIKREENKCEAELRNLRNEDLQNELVSKNKSEPIRKEIDTLDDNFQQQKIDFEHDRKVKEINLQSAREDLAAQKKREAEKAQKKHEHSILDMRREEEIKQAAHSIEAEKRTFDLLGLQVKRLAMQKEKDTAEAASIVMLGKAKADVVKEQTLAVKADVIKITEDLLKALPDVMQKAYQPCQKMGEVRMLVVNNPRNPSQSSEHDGADNSMFGTILNSMSLIPLVKEAIEFIRESPNTFSSVRESKTTESKIQSCEETN